MQKPNPQQNWKIGTLDNHDHVIKVLGGPPTPYLQRVWRGAGQPREAGERAKEEERRIPEQEGTKEVGTQRPRPQAPASDPPEARLIREAPGSEGSHRGGVTPQAQPPQMVFELM